MLFLRCALKVAKMGTLGENDGPDNPVHFLLHEYNQHLGTYPKWVLFAFVLWKRGQIDVSYLCEAGFPSVLLLQQGMLYSCLAHTQGYTCLQYLHSQG